MAAALRALSGRPCVPDTAVERGFAGRAPWGALTVKIAVVASSDGTIDREWSL